MLKNENYNKQMLIGLVVTVLLLAAFSIQMFGEPARLEKVSQEHDKETLLYGRELFVQNCTSCHGTRGEGTVGPALNNKALLEEANDDVLFATIRAGRPGTIMPAWGQAFGGALTDEDIRAVVSFIRAFEPNAPEVVVDEFEPSAARGASLFADTCFACHGDNGKGTETVPAINDRAKLKKYDNHWYEQVIVNGLPANGMPIWGGTLSDHQIQDLLALIDAWRAGEEVKPETTVADMLNAALFSLEQKDSADALFYLNRAKPIAFGPLLKDINTTIGLVESGKDSQALTAMTNLRDAWPTGDPAVGAEIFQQTCSGCHGTEGQGGVGKKLHPSDFIQNSTNAEVFAFVQTGRPGTAMRSFKGVLTEEQLADIISFLRTWQE